MGSGVVEMGLWSGWVGVGFCGVQAGCGGAGM